MKAGGIFGNVALGTEPMPLVSCDLRREGFGEQKTIEALQTITRDFGATKLKSDGDWGNCSERAFRNVFGEPASEAFLLQAGLLACKQGTFRKTAGVGDKPCSNGTDVVAESKWEKIPPEAPPAATPGLLSTNFNVPNISKILLASMEDKAEAPPPAEEPPPAPFRPPASTATTETGMPGWFIYAGAAALVLGAAIAWRMKK